LINRNRCRRIINVLYSVFVGTLLRRNYLKNVLIWYDMAGKKSSGPAAPVQDPEQLKNLLLVLEHARADAWLRKNRDTLDVLLIPEFIEINCFGCFKKDDLLIRFFPRVTHHTFTLEDPVIVIPSAGSAILTYVSFEERTVDQKKRRSTSRVAAHYCWNGKQWKLALRQETPVC